MRRRAARIGDAGLLRDILESSVPAIAVQEVGAAGQPLRTTRHRNIVEAAVRRFARKRYALRVEVHVVGDEQVQMAIAIVIEKTTTGSPPVPAARDAGLLGNIGESAVTVVVIEHVPAPVADKQVVEAVVVIVADTAALAPSGVSQAGLPGDIGEGAVAIVTEKIAGGFWRARLRLKRGAVHQEDIQPAVVVEIEEGHAAAHLLQQKPLAGRAAGNIAGPGEPGLHGDVGEVEGRGRPGSPSQRKQAQRSQKIPA